MAFYNRMRDSVRDLGDFGGGGGFAESDSLSKMGSLNVLDKLLNMGGRNNRIGRIPPPNPKVNPYGRAVDPTKGPMNVVYDQGPEQFAKQSKLRERALDVEQSKVDALAGLKQADLDIKRQNADTNLFRAQTTDRVRDLTDEEKMQAALEKALGVEGLRQGGANQRTDKVIQGRATEGEFNRNVTREEGAADRGSREKTTQMTVTGALDREKDKQAFEAGKPGPLAQQLKGRIEEQLNLHPEWRNLVTWDDEAKAYGINPPKKAGLFSGGEDLATAADRAEFMRSIYGPQERSINQNKGNDASALSSGGQPTNNRVMTKTQTNRSGQTRTLQSNDGGITWQVRQ